MTPIKTTFQADGFTHTQVKRVGNVALFSKFNGKVLTFEIVRVIQHPAHAIAGRTFHAHESYPTADQWGTDAFSANTVERALEIFDDLLAKQRQRSHK